MIIVSVSCAGKNALYVLISFIWAVSDFILPILQLNTGCFPIQKRPEFSQFWRFFSQPEDFIRIYSQILKAKAVSPKRQ